MRSNYAEVLPSPIDLRELRSQLGSTAWERPLAPVLVALALHIAFAFGGLGVFVLSPWLAVRIPAIVISTYGFIGLGTVGHTASHGALCRTRVWDRVVLYALYPLVLGVSATYWQYSHLKVHHRAPNVSGVDADTDLRPLFALNEEHLRDNGGLRERHPKVQASLLLLILPFNTFLIHFQGFGHLLGVIRKRTYPRAGLVVDLTCLAAHYAAWLVIPTLWFQWQDVMALYVLRLTLIGVGVFAVLAPGHYPRAAACLSERLFNALPHVTRQVVTTVDFRAGALGRLLCSGLDLQAEHHVFPGMSHVELARAAPAIRRYLQERGVPVRELGWGEAVVESFRTLLYPKRVHDDFSLLLAERSSPLGYVGSRPAAPSVASSPPPTSESLAVPEALGGG